MPPFGAAPFTLKPSWFRRTGILATCLAIFIGTTRFIIFDSWDPIHCNALLNTGSWLDSSQQNWQPNGCMLHSYNPLEASTCLGQRRVVFIGDSITRKLFFQFARLLDRSLPSGPPEDKRKHSDYTFLTDHSTNITFLWDPFLNSSHTQSVLARNFERSQSSEHTPALLVLGSGLWYLRYANSSGGIPVWEANMERLLDTLQHNPTRIADHVVLLPIEQVVTSKLSHDRASTMHPWDIDAMNSDLFHRIKSSSEDFHVDHSSPRISLPMAFNQILDPTQTNDGLHFSESVIRIQANILLNLRCNDVMPKRFPFDKTCCNRYPWPSMLQFIVLALTILLGPYMCHRTYVTASQLGRPFSLGEKELPFLIISGATGLIFLADRTGFWLKEQKQYNAFTVAFLYLASLAVGLFTIKRADKDMGFLNRDQTDEWKGWMQIAILIYHYFGASKISGIYNPIRILVASYLFMTGYGHTTFYLKKADFSFARIAQVMVRLNFLTVLLAYTMNTDYISYYFAPLVSMWFMIIYFTMAVASRFNEHTVFLLSKILISATLATSFMWQNWPLEILFDFLRRFCGIHWSAREWTFRVNLDIWIVYFGMLAAIVVIKIREHRLTDHSFWPMSVKIASAASVAVLVWFFAFELYQESKFAYNAWHPYISFLPVLAFVVLRNSTAILRSSASTGFAFIGKCSLETFIIQYHFWLAGDTKGVLLVIPGTRWRVINIIISTFMFIFISDRVAYATGEITTKICGGTAKTLPVPNTASLSSHRGSNNAMSRSEADTASGDGQEIEIGLTSQTPTLKDSDGNLLPREPDTPNRQRRWVDRLADGASSSRETPGFKVWYGENEWGAGLKTKLGIIVCVMWVMNMAWSYADRQ